MDECQYFGQWWLPENYGERVGGVLEFRPTDGGTLELVEPLDSATLDLSQTADIIHGAADGHRITLKGCFVTGGHHRGGTTVTNTEEWHVNKIFVGGHSADSEILLDRVQFTVPLFERWTGKNPVINPDGHPWSAEVSWIDPLTVDLGDVTLKLKFSVDANTNVHHGANFEHIDYFVIEPEDQLPFSTFLNDYIRHLQHFLCLGIAEPVQPTEVTGYIEQDDDEPPQEIDIKYQVSHTPAVPDSKHPNHFNFHLADIDFEAAIEKWFDSIEGAEILHNFYFSTQYNKQMHIENYFMNLVTGLESYHDNVLFSDHTIIPEEEWDDLQEEIYALLPENEEFQNKIEGLLGAIGNKRSLRNKLEALMGEYEVLEELIDIEDVARDATSLRNNLAHGLSSDYDNRELARTEQKMGLVVQTCFLDLMGLPDEHIQDRLETNRSTFVDI